MAGRVFLPAPFPAPSRTSTTLVLGTPTTVTLISFADKILITISQSGRLSHWVHVPLLQNTLDATSGMPTTSSAGGGDELLPMSHLTATTVLGGTKREDEIVGQTLATTVASAVLVKRPLEERLLVVGLGLQDGAAMGRAGFDGILGLVLDML